MTTKIANRKSGKNFTTQRAGMASIAELIGTKTDWLATLLMLIIAVTFELFSIATWAFAPRPKPTHSVTLPVEIPEQSIAPVDVSEKELPEAANDASAADVMPTNSTGVILPDKVTRLTPRNAGVSSTKLCRPSVGGAPTQLATSIDLQTDAFEAIENAPVPQLPPTNQPDAFAALFLARKARGNAPVRQVRAVYEDWCTDQNVEPVSANKFGREMTALGYKRGRTGKNSNHAYIGVVLRGKRHG